MYIFSSEDFFKITSKLQRKIASVIRFFIEGSVVKTLSFNTHILLISLNHDLKINEKYIRNSYFKKLVQKKLWWILSLRR